MTRPAPPLVAASADSVPSPPAVLACSTSSRCNVAMFAPARRPTAPAAGHYEMVTRTRGEVAANSGRFDPPPHNPAARHPSPAVTSRASSVVSRPSPSSAISRCTTAWSARQVRGQGARRARPRLRRSGGAVTPSDRSRRPVSTASSRRARCSRSQPVAGKAGAADRIDRGIRAGSSEPVASDRRQAGRRRRQQGGHSSADRGIAGLQV